MAGWKCENECIKTKEKGAARGRGKGEKEGVREHDRMEIMQNEEKEGERRDKEARKFT